MVQKMIHPQNWWLEYFFFKIVHTLVVCLVPYFEPACISLPIHFSYNQVSWWEGKPPRDGGLQKLDLNKICNALFQWAIFLPRCLKSTLGSSKWSRNQGQKKNLPKTDPNRNNQGLSNFYHNEIKVFKVFPLFQALLVLFAWETKIKPWIYPLTQGSSHHQDMGPGGLDPR